MNDDTKFILRRMEALEGRIMKELKDLQAWKNRMIGIAIVCGSAGSLIVKEVLKHL